MTLTDANDVSLSLSLSPPQPPPLTLSIESGRGGVNCTLYTRMTTILFILLTRISLYVFSVIIIHVYTRSVDCHSTHCTHDQWWLPGSDVNAWQF
jgi:hypothetical protein